ncbi:MAG: hypothetical protein ACKO6Q_04000 [Bacteroidota bacterium]
MKKNHQLQLHVPDPCTQSWSDMTPLGAERFCQACTKNIIDFSTYTDAELIAYFTQKRSGQVCGRFSTKQLDRPLRTSGSWWSWVRGIAALLLPLFMHTRADAQRTDPGAQVSNREPEKVRGGKQPMLLGIMVSPNWIQQKKDTDLGKEELDPRMTSVTRGRGKDIDRKSKRPTR